MADVPDAARPQQTPETTDAATPPPTATFYDAVRNKRWGVATLEDIQAEFQGNQKALAARIRDDKIGRHKRTWGDLVERASDGVRMKVLKQTVDGTKRSTETMVLMTGYSAPTTQLRIQLADFFPWGAPVLRVMWERSQIENEPGKGVRDFEMPSDRVIIEMGQAAAKKAGCWGVPQMLLITSAHKTVEAHDLPKALGWDQKRQPPYPWWEDQGALSIPWQDFHLFTEVQESGRDPQPAWSLGLFVRNGEPVMFYQRGFVVRCTNGIYAGAADNLTQLQPYVSFVAAQQAEDAAAKVAETANWPVVADKTGKRHATLDDIAAQLNMKPSALVEHLHRRGYLNLQGEATPAALDAGITTVIDGGTQFVFEAVETLLKSPKIKVVPADEPATQGQPTGGNSPLDGDITAADVAGKQDQPSPVVDPVTESADVPDVAENEEPADVADATGRRTVRPGGGMRRVSAQPDEQPVKSPETEVVPADEPVTPAQPAGRNNPTDEDITATELAGKQDQPSPVVDPVIESADVPDVAENEEPADVADATGCSTIKHGGGMRRVSAQLDEQPVIGVDEVAPAATGSVHDTDAASTQAVETLERGMKAILEQNPIILAHSRPL